MKSNGFKMEVHQGKETEETRSGSLLQKKGDGYELEGQKKYLHAEQHT
jgi:hypothetical protein